MPNLINHSWSVHDEDDDLWIEANDEQRLVIADAPLGVEYTPETRAEQRAIFEHIVRLHNDSLLGGGK